MASSPSGSGRRRLIIDTDPGLDDAIALCMAIKLAPRYGADLVLVTCSHGNCSLDLACTNMARIALACGLSAGSNPLIIRGASHPLLGKAEAHELIDAAFFHGKDGLRDSAKEKTQEINVFYIVRNGEG